MGMYVCIPHQEKYQLREGMAGAGHAICEICGYIDGDWRVKIPVVFAPDIDRPILVSNPKQYVQGQLDRLKGIEKTEKEK